MPQHEARRLTLEQFLSHESAPHVRVGENFNRAAFRRNAQGTVFVRVHEA
jgi:hypothetical protein